MNKCEIVKLISDRCAISKKKSLEVLDCIYDIICFNLRCGKNFCVRDFGKFYVRITNEKYFKTKDGLKFIPCKMVPKFKAGKKFKNIVN